MKEQKIIAFVGMPGSGKGTCTNYLNEKHGWPVVHFGNMVYEEVQRRGLDNVKDEVFVREDMRKQDGKAVLAKHVATKADQYFGSGQAVIILDGLYSWSEYKFLAEKYGTALIMIAIAAPKALRHKRVLLRNDAHRKYTLPQLINREVAEIENLEKGGPIAMADYTIVNDATPEELLNKLDRITAEIGLSN